MLTLLISILGIVGLVLKSKKEEVEGDEVLTFERSGVMKIVGGVIVIAAIIFLFLTQNFSLPMQLVDNWTFITVIIAIASAIVFFFSARWNESEE